jgi:hypothetical protein
VAIIEAKAARNAPHKIGKVNEEIGSLFDQLKILKEG